MSKHRLSEKELRRIRRERRRTKKAAYELLESPEYFNKFVDAVGRAGLVGEKLNALLLEVAINSRALDRPVNVFVKGRSSGGKNWLVTRVLRLMPQNAVAEVTSSSDHAWNYSQKDLSHRVVYLHEENEAVGMIDPLRILISEGKLIRKVTQFRHGKRVTVKQVTMGPVMAISTTTKNRLKIDDETRHVSIWVDESSTQTREIARNYTLDKGGLCRAERSVWQMAHRLIKHRGAAIKITFPPWFSEVADRLFVDDLRVRRYYPAFIEACRTVCLIRSFQRDRRSVNHNALEVDFADFAIAAIIFDQVFVESLHLNRGSSEDTRRLVEDISSRKGRPVKAKDLARAMEISMDQAYRKLRYAQQVGIVRQANKPERSNRKAYLAAPRPRFVPDPEKLFYELKFKKKVSFVHPLTGTRIEYKTKK